MSDTKISKDLFANVNSQHLKTIFPLLKNHPDKYQFIYASQLYGTFFCVFAKVVVQNEVLKTMELKLINYKGHINIGILESTEEGWELDPYTNDYNLTMDLKAADGVNIYTANKTITVTCNTPISLLSTIGIRRCLHPMDNGVSTSMQLERGIFDSEFFDRDGEFVYSKPLTDEILLDYKQQNPGIKTGRTCNETTLTLV